MGGELLVGDWMAGAWLEGKLAGGAIRGLEGEIGQFGVKNVGKELDGGDLLLAWGLAGKSCLYVIWQGVGGGVSVSKKFCM